MPFIRDEADPYIGPVLRLQSQLLQLTRQWATGETVDPKAESLRREALVLNHSRYVRLIPAYHQLADEQGLLGTGTADLDTIVNQMMVGTGIFKSYNAEWVGDGNFAAMTDWLGSIFSHALDLDAKRIENLSQWQCELEQAGVTTTLSSGTSGQTSFVPRDPLTMRSYTRNSRSYANTDWYQEQDGTAKVFDCLVVGPRGTSTGIQASASGLASLAGRSHYLFEAELTGEMLHDRDASRKLRRPDSESTDAYESAFQFIRQSISDARPLLIFGAPFQILRLCQRVESFGRVTATPGSTLVTGGGWKSFSGQKIPQEQLYQFVETVFGIRDMIDAYGAAELNCSLVSCTRRHYHIPPLLEPVVLDDAYMGTAGSEGDGVLGFMDPYALSYPGFLISGDVGRLRRGKCECGLDGWYIDGEIRRAEGHEIKGCGGVMASIIA